MSLVGFHPYPSRWHVVSAAAAAADVQGGSPKRCARERRTIGLASTRSHEKENEHVSRTIDPGVRITESMVGLT